MKLMFPKRSAFVLIPAVLSILLVFASPSLTQTKKATPAKTAVAKKQTSNPKDVKKNIEKGKPAPKSTAATKQPPTTKAVNSKNAKAPDPKSKAQAKTNTNKSTNTRNTANNRNSAAEQTKNQKGKPQTAAQKRNAAAEQRRRDEARRQAALAEQRRREQAAREARARKIAFERGLRTETVANISRDVVEGEDLEIRKAAIDALGEHAGSVVVMEAQTGKVLTVVNQDWALRSGIKPCSTIKLVTGVAGLNENVINKENGTLMASPSGLNLDDALAQSNNPYFQRAGATFGNPKMIAYAQQLGLGEPTGLNVEGEYAGKLPHGNNNPRIYSHGDDFEVTGIQLAVMVSAIANGGNRVLPRVPRNTIDNAKFQAFYKSRVEVPQPSVRRVIPGMMGAAEYGTARRNLDQSLGVAGKTGSCISKGTWVGLFASVAPIEEPKYAVVVITRGEQERGRNAAAIAARIYQTLGKDIVRTNRNLAQTEFNLPPKGPIQLATAALLNDEEDDSDSPDAERLADAAAGDEKVNDVVVVPSAPRQQIPERSVPKKLVTKTSDSKPIFPPVVITYEKESKEENKEKADKKGSKP